MVTGLRLLHSLGITKITFTLKRRGRRIRGGERREKKGEREREGGRREGGEEKEGKEERGKEEKRSWCSLHIHTRIFLS